MKRAFRVLRLLVVLAFLGFSGQALGQNESAGMKNQKNGQVQKQQKPMKQHTVRDQDRNGVCDVCGQPTGSGLKNAKGKKADKGKHWGPGDGSGNQSDRPQDGTGYGSKSGNRSGTVDGTGGGRGQRGGSGRRGGRN